MRRARAGWWVFVAVVGCAENPSTARVSAVSPREDSDASSGDTIVRAAEGEPHASDAAVSSCDPNAETCGATDDDCDSRADAGLSRTCPHEGAIPETCVEGQDSGCTHHADENDEDERGCEATSRHRVSFGALQTFDPACVDHGEPAACMHAAFGLCQQDECERGGFGPVKYNGTTVTVVCTVSTILETRYTELRRHHPDCTGLPGQRFSLPCNIAMQRHCALAGYTGGYGPVLDDGDVVHVGCVGSHATVVTTPLDELARQNPLCDDGRLFGLACAHAIHRFCTERGAVSGFGPVGVDRLSALVVCLSK
jgi:hypothetical protein